MNASTIAREAVLEGIGTHTGAMCRVVLRPREDGISFNGTPLRIENASADSGCTSTGGVHTIEHLCSALHALGIDAASVETDSPEVPIFDGSALPIYRIIKAAGVKKLAA
ncbi:MAG: UDP-3-O-acyl-N-acetylglucosamine deacetylase, partial [Rickettsiales bacterium]|nr:UDP-3-O-acyl-N-acetylglucosamine deacetylase [Rickettsiales bacterium]